MNSLLNIKNYGNPAKFHIIGIGGIGMSGIAEILYNLGYQIQGSDIKYNSNIERLKKLGIKIFIDHHPSNIETADYVVISSSIKESNIEYQQALIKKIPIIQRSEMLAEIMRMKICISISGSHGKTSTTSIVASVLEAAGLEPTVINGGIINNKSTNAYVGTGDYLVAEADESDATFIKIPSTIGVVTNIDPEHLDYYGSFDNLYLAFKNFIKGLPFYGFAAVCIDNEISCKLAKEVIERKIITYGIKSKEAHIQAFNITTNIDCSIFSVRVNLPHRGINYVIENLKLSIPGEHNILNCLASIAIAAELDFGVGAIHEGLKNFKGVKRRFTVTNNIGGIRFIDDYAHHPSEILETLKTAKSALENKTNKVIAVFQPHRFSRLYHLFSDFVNCFALADKIYITPVFAAGENKIENYDSEKLIKDIKSRFKDKIVYYAKSEQQISDLISKDNLLSGDIVLFMGAGNITEWAYNIPKIFKKEKNISK